MPRSLILTGSPLGLLVDAEFDAAVEAAIEAADTGEDNPTNHTNPLEPLPCAAF